MSAELVGFKKPPSQITQTSIIGLCPRNPESSESSWNHVNTQKQENAVTITRLTYSAVIFVTGLGVGAFWSPFGARPQLPANHQGTTGPHVASDAQVEELPSELRKRIDAEVEDFAGQFKDMNIRIEKYPLDAWASQDGRFVIHLLKSNEMIASELRQIGPRGVTVMDRHYEYSCGDIAYHCDFARHIEGSNMYSVLFGVEFKGKTKVVYLDSDGDGLWDRITDFTQEHPKTYVREGSGWNWKEMDVGKKR
jgi:hypothetical protein